MQTTQDPSGRVLAAWIQTLAAVTAERGEIQVVPFSENDERLPRLRASVLAFDQTRSTIIFSKPLSGDSTHALSKGVAVGLVLSHEGARFKALAEVKDIGRFAIDPDRKVTAVKLGHITNITEAYRREAPRISAVGLPIDPIQMMAIDCNVEPSSVEGSLLDLNSKGLGMWVKVPFEVALGMRGQDYQLALNLPDCVTRLILCGRVVRASQDEDKLVTIGLEFDFESAAEERHVEQVIHFFASTQQRKKLPTPRRAS